MEPRLQNIEDKLDSIHRDLNLHMQTTEHRVTKLETTQKGVVALCVAVLTAALTSMAKALHIG